MSDKPIMNWNASGEGTAEEAKASVIQLTGDIPEDVKAAFTLVIDTLPHTHNIAWSTHGHIGADQGHVRIDVQTVAHMPEPKPA